MTSIERETLRTKVEYIRNRQIDLEGKLSMLEPDKEADNHWAWDDSMALMAETFYQLNELEGMLK